MKSGFSFTTLKFLSLAGLILCLAGCKPAIDTSPVSGTVKVDGKLVTEGQVIFHPTGGGRASYGTIADDGSYVMMTETAADGVPPGSYKVCISAEKRVGGKPAPENMTPEEEAEFVPDRGKVVAKIAPKYSSLEATTLTAEVEAGKPNEINFDSADFK